MLAPTTLAVLRSHGKCLRMYIYTHIHKYMKNVRARMDVAIDPKIFLIRSEIGAELRMRDRIEFVV